jgi:hypothetical protein
MTTCSPLLAALPLLIASPAVAQIRPERVVAETPAQATPPEPAGHTGGFLNGLAFELEVSEEESTASAELGGWFRSERGSGESSVTQYNGNWSVAASLPVGGADDLTSSSTLDALRDGVKLTGSLSFFRFRSAAHNLASEAFREAMRDANRNCIAQEENDALCSERPDPDFAIRYSGRGREGINRILYRGILQAGVDVSLGFDRFEYFEASTLAKRDDDELQFGAGLFVAYYPASGTSGIIGRVEYQNAYQAVEDAVVCRSVVVDPDEDCAFGAGAPPEHVERLNISAEYRRAFDLRRSNGSLVGMLAISPKVTVDALSGEHELEVPVYYVPRGDWPIAPGVSLTYSSEDDEVGFGVFLRTSFTLN